MPRGEVQPVGGLVELGEPQAGVRDDGGVDGGGDRGEVVDEPAGEQRVVGGGETRGEGVAREPGGEGEEGGVGRRDVGGEREGAVGEEAGEAEGVALARGEAEAVVAGVVVEEGEGGGGGGGG